MNDITGLVTERALEKFKTLYKNKYGITLTDEEATEQATAFLHLMSTILKQPISENSNGKSVAKEIIVESKEENKDKKPYHDQLTLL